MGIMERKMKGFGVDGRHRDKNGEISKKHGNTLVSTLRKFTARHSRPGRRAMRS
jgi:hypothetical protein